MAVINNSVTGGWNGSAVKTTYSALSVVGASYTPGQHTPFGIKTNSYGVGDTLGINVSMEAEGGANAANDEGLEPLNYEIIYGNLNLAATVGAGVTTGSSVLPLVTPGTNLGTAGAGRFLMDITQAAPCSTSGASPLTISSIAGSGLTTMTLSGAGCPVSTAQTTTTAAITTGDAFVSVNMAVAASAGFTVGGVVVVADGLSYETATVSAIPDATHIIATLRKNHASGAFVAQGGAAGYVVSLTADTYTVTGTHGIFSVPIPVPQAWPVVYSDATHLYIWIDGTGTYQPYVGSAALTAGTNAFNLYPAAEVTDVSNGTGHPTNTLSVAPNTAPWTPGDTVNLPPYPYAKTNWGHMFYSKMQPTPSGQGGGFSWTYDGVWNGGDQALTVVNNTPTSLYSYYANGGLLTPPGALNFKGLFGTGVTFDHAVTTGVLELKYDAENAAGGANAILKADNATSADNLSYDTRSTALLWNLTAGSGALTFRARGNGVSVLSTASPTVASCGTGATLIASNNSGTVTVGTGGITTCSVTFAPAWSATPSCTVTEEDGGTAPAYTVSLTGISLTFAASKAGILWDWTCIGHG